MGIEYSASQKIPQQNCYLFGPPNTLLIYKTNTDEFVKKTLSQVSKNMINQELQKNMACVWVGDSTIYFSGGINDNHSEVSNRVFRYNVDDDVFRNLPPMNVPRYTHQLLYNKYDQMLYALGGRSYGAGNEGILNKCECYNLLKGKWVDMPSMNFKRATFFSVIVNQKIFVFGGYTDIKKRSRKIECFDGQEWKILNFRLQYGVEQGVLFQNDKQEIFILGGQSEEGVVQKHQVIDFSKQMCYVANTTNQCPRLLQKGYQVDNFIVQLFGDQKLSLEKGLIHKLEQKDLSKDQVLNSIGVANLTQFIVADYTIELGVFNRQQAKHLFIIQEDIIYKINKGYFSQQNLSKLNQFKDKSLIQSTKILKNKLFLFSGAILQKDGGLIIIGGVNNQMNFISSEVIKLDSNLQSYSKLAKLNQARYAFSFTQSDDCIYVAGGRFYGNDDQGILGTCERYNITSNKWEMIGSLIEKRCGSIMIHHNSRILVAGGFNTFKTRLNSIEIFQEQTNSWQMLGITLEGVVEACAFHSISRDNIMELITFGGRSTIDTDNVVKYSFDFDEPLDHQIGQFQQLKPLTFKNSLLQKIVIDDYLFIIGQNAQQQIQINSFNLITKELIHTELSTCLLELLSELKIINIGKMSMID